MTDTYATGHLRTWRRGARRGGTSTSDLYHILKIDYRYGPTDALARGTTICGKPGAVFSAMTLTLQAAHSHLAGLGIVWACQTCTKTSARRLTNPGG